MKLFYATTNTAKVESLKAALGSEGFEIVQQPLSIPEPRLDRVEDIARFKAMFAYQELKQPVVALDAGFFIHILNGFPRSFVNFALETVKVEGMLQLVAAGERTAEFRHSLAYHDGRDDTPAVFTDTVKGTIAQEPRGTLRSYHWSVLSAIFIPEGETKTLAEFSEDEYHAWHTQRLSGNSYAKQFLAWYRTYRS
ncbi:MAG: hypothetical protein HY975_01290 [Candidatus Kerfeldbacteria bacterium]|nr:hypothetical protein [Candidatus Kerfeldbacteria bacterium]